MITRLQGLRAYQNKPIGYICADCRRQLSGSAILKSGHSKWATIKHDKAKQDANLSKSRAVHAKAIADAVKAGGADAIINPRLALALSIAKKAGFPKASIDSAILRGQGRSASGAPLENMTIEAVIPPVGLIIECQTDSKARTLQDLRGMLKNHGGTQSPAAYLFEKRGRITFQSKEGVGVDEVLDAALEAGALDVTADDTGRLVLDTVVESTAETETRLVQQMGLEVESSDTLYFPNADTKIDSVEPATLEVLRKLQDALEEYPGVHGVYMNFDIEGAYADIENAAVDAQ